MTCADARAALLAFDPDGSELADAVAVHLDSCVACRGVFDARFPPWLEPRRRAGWPWLAAAAALLLAVGAFAADRFLAASAETAPLVLAEQAPPAGDLSSTTWLVGSGSTSFSDVTVVVFWEAWCAHCDDWLGYLDDLAEALPELDVVGVTQLSRGVTEPEARAYIDRLGLRFPSAWDRDGSVSARFGARQWPRAYLVVNGRIAWEGHPNGLDVTSLQRILR